MDTAPYVMTTQHLGADPYSANRRVYLVKAGILYDDSYLPPFAAQRAVCYPLTLTRP